MSDKVTVIDALFFIEIFILHQHADVFYEMCMHLIEFNLIRLGGC